MDDNYYSEETIKDFENRFICLNQKDIITAYKNGDVNKYRRLLKKYATRQETQHMVYVFVTDSIRHVLRKEIIPELTKFLRPYGELVMAGGEAFNTFVDKEHRIATSDIDTKFIPLFESKNYFRNLQILKINFWEKINKIIKKFENKIRINILKNLKNSKISKMLGISIPTSGILLKRRYTLMMKSRSNHKSNKISPGNTLIDVELFAIDMTVRYFDIESDKVAAHNLGGILDIAFMRPGEFGSEIYKNFTKNSDGIQIAGKRFFLDDLYIMQKLGLRPGKKRKDKERMIAFAKHVAGIQNPKGTFEQLYNASKKKIKPVLRSHRKVKFAYSSEVEKARKVNPLADIDRIVQPNLKKLYTMAYGVKGPQGLEIKNYIPTNSRLRVNINRGKWVENNRTNYIRNEYNYRMNQNSNVKIDISKIPMPLYAYKTRRNYNIPRNIVNKSIAIQFGRR